jgi:Asp-tRNA(Asn)/Glu-tRNA(Gln) amidotransferase A subunit family amidase
MKDVDLIMSPSCIGEVPPKIKDILDNKNKDQSVYEYMQDYYTVLANCLGMPALTIPVSE